MVSRVFDTDGFLSGDTPLAVTVSDGATQEPYIFINTTNKAVDFEMFLSDDAVVVRDDKYENGTDRVNGDRFVLPPYHSRVVYVSNATGSDETIGMTIDTTIVRGANNAVGSVYVRHVN